MAASTFEIIQQNIVSQLEKGVIPWIRCFHVDEAGCAYSHNTQEPYSFINQWLLQRPGEYWTFKQAQNEGFHIRKGAKAGTIVFWKRLTKTEKKEDSDEEFVRSFPFLRSYSVFHESDVVGLPPKTALANREGRNAEKLDIAEAIVESYLARNTDISLATSTRSFPSYCPSDGTIRMPEKSQFDSLSDYYDALFHEMVHSTARYLNRTHNYGDLEQRAKEELVAEIGSAYLCGRCGITEKVIKNQTAYCQTWLNRLRDDIKPLVWASSRAERAVRYILDEETPDREG